MTLPSYYSVPLAAIPQGPSPGQRMACAALFATAAVLLLVDAVSQVNPTAFYTPVVTTGSALVTTPSAVAARPGAIKPRTASLSTRRRDFHDDESPAVTRAPGVAAVALATSLAVAAPALAANPIVGILGPILSLLITFLNFYQFALFVRIILTWFTVDLWRPPFSYLCRITDPLLNGTRGIIPPLFGLDFGPTLALLAISYITSTLQAGLMQMMIFR